MANVRIIPRLDIKGPNVVKGIHMEGIRIVGNPRELALAYTAQGADELVIMDVVASLYQRNLDFELLKTIVDDIYIPITAGGGIRSLHDMSQALRAGADKVALNTYAIHHPEIIREAAETFGAQCVVVSIEAKKIHNGFWEAYTDGGREKTGINAIDWARKAIAMGAGELMVTSIDAEGARGGFDHDLIREVSSLSPISVIAGGGAGALETISEIIAAGGPDAVAIASVLHYGDMTVQEVKNHLLKQKIPVRLAVSNEL